MGWNITLTVLLPLLNNKADKSTAAIQVWSYEKTQTSFWKNGFRLGNACKNVPGKLHYTSLLLLQCRMTDVANGGKPSHVTSLSWMPLNSKKNSKEFITNTTPFVQWRAIKQNVENKPNFWCLRLQWNAWKCAINCNCFHCNFAISFRKLPKRVS